MGYTRIQLSFLVLVVASLAACQTNPATTEPPTTAPPPATDTPVPPSPTAVLPATATAPSATETPLPTEAAVPTSPATASTPDPNLNVGRSLWEDQFDGTSGWSWTYKDDVATFSLAEGQLNAVMSRSDAGWRISGGPQVRAGDQQIRLATRTNLCYEKDEYGVLFRGKLDERGRFSGYLFKINCGGQARLEALRNHEVSVLADWIPTPAIQPGAPAENVLLVWAAGEQINLYVNDKFIGTFTDKNFSEGDFGLYLRDRTNGGLSVSFTSLTVKEVIAP